MDERRSAGRTQLELPCKVWHPRALRFLPGVTRDLSRDGAMLELRGGAPFRNGERVRVGLPDAAAPIVLRSADLLEGTVVRSSNEEGRMVVAVTFDGVDALRAESIAG
jgi:PilZ domain